MTILRPNTPPTKSDDMQRRPKVSADYSMTDGKYYSDDEIAGLLGISLGRLRNKLCAGNPLPPRIQPPGCRSRLWPCREVHDWLRQFTVGENDLSLDDAKPRRPGRPTKAEARARRR